MKNWKLFVASVGALGLIGCAPRLRNEACSYDGMIYGQEARTCQPSQYTQYRCDDGRWRSTGVDCTGSAPVASVTGCELSGYAYANGSTSCQSGIEYYCDSGSWRSQRTHCVAGDAPYSGARLGRSCMFGDVVEANDTTVCRGFSMYQCRDGEWVNLGTACR